MQLLEAKEPAHAGAGSAPSPDHATKLDGLQSKGSLASCNTRSVARALVQTVRDGGTAHSPALTAREAMCCGTTAAPEPQMKQRMKTRETAMFRAARAA